MEHQEREIILKTNVIDAKRRIDDLISQFKGWMKDQENTASISLHFYTSEEHPLTMGEISHFLNSISDVLDVCNIEWSSQKDETLNKQIIIEIIFNNQ